MKAWRYILITVLVGLDQLTSFTDYQSASSLCLVLILLFGIPHGAVDHRIHLSVSERDNFFSFLVRYLSVVAIYILLWLLHTPSALILFLLISAYHFGQELLEDLKIEDQTALSMLAGVFIIFSPLLYHIQETKVFINIIAPGLLDSIVPSLALFLSVLFLVLFVASSLVLFFNKGMTRRQLKQLCLFVASVVVLNLFLSLLIAFTLYFILFHSFNAFAHQYQWLRKRSENYTVKRFIGDLLGFSLLAIVGILLLLWILNPSGTSELISYFFILVSLITLPHAITLDQFYKFKQSKRVSLTD